ncbi:alpha-xenorhabdolysin family binary toxin subunit B [Providencia rettgeri]|nr:MULTISPECIES: alpha-xenorhabdolysin family binary toxin subunit B [Providencia]EIU7558244.1 alpha-xenorhabdolysin family binary toxin subunit B [Providencia rettgeri]EJD6498318.1 alpha-xenorhabdolysin family binary toxin subunit B [Providencia rettgeri]EJD6641910.1 alpha-xenorhabdolysin family binary toxin subunit B [Providencia rettgeri]ELL9153636.1 alpha-xenorhabdolysin family binary toxin subunit B [Providencia rettgeri]ELR5032839.1 alpha-xenorhabdolysin family binary toxin subunit B [Pr
MHDNNEIPVLPSIDVYQLRCISNSIIDFNKNIKNYDYVIYDKINKIAIKTESLNQLIRNSIPIIKIKLDYIIFNDLNENNNDNHHPDNIENLKNKILTVGFIEDLIELKLELEKFIYKIRFTTDSLQTFNIDKPNKNKLQEYNNQKGLLSSAKKNIQMKINEVNQQHSIIKAAEDIILKTKITDFFEKYFLNQESIDSIDIPKNKKQILKMALRYIKNLLAVVDDGLEFLQLVDVRLYLSDLIIELKGEMNAIDTNIFRVSKLISLSEEISTIVLNVQSVITQANLLRNYLESWCDFINEHVSEQTLNVPHIHVASKIFMTYLNEVEYQYQLQLPD